MREVGPVHYSEPIKMWYVFGYQDVQRILADARTFSSAGAHGDSYLEASFIHMDPPRHGRYRTLVSQAFTPRRIALLEPRITTIVNGLLDAVAHAGRMDLITDPVPGATLPGSAPDRRANATSELGAGRLFPGTKHFPIAFTAGTR